LGHGTRRASSLLQAIESTLRCVASLRQLGHCGKEFFRLPDEKTASSEKLNYPHCEPRLNFEGIGKDRRQSRRPFYGQGLVLGCFSIPETPSPGRVTAGHEFAVFA
jgi:hypothetical protein